MSAQVAWGWARGRSGLGADTQVRPYRSQARSACGQSWHDAASTLPASTRKAGAFAEAAASLEALDVDLDGSTKVPVSSSFLPTCGLNEAGFATSRYVCPG